MTTRTIDLFNPTADDLLEQAMIDAAAEDAARARAVAEGREYGWTAELDAALCEADTLSQRG